MTQIVYTDGIYDLFHRGHVESFIQIKAQFPGCRLLVGIINDVDATAYKRKPLYNEDDRYCIVEHMDVVDEIIKSAPLTVTKEFMEKHKIDWVVHGFCNSVDAAKQDDFYKIPKLLDKFMETKYYSGTSTTAIIAEIKRIY